MIRWKSQWDASVSQMVAFMDLDHRPHPCPASQDNDQPVPKGLDPLVPVSGSLD
ncbi:hypothetical protein HanRHA438_Chr11g0516841 [Helianthus annuus]|nr:hypothetical protein HanRHA438_Chr11g0516841 [Helianthus annuus]